MDSRARERTVIIFALGGQAGGLSAEPAGRVSRRAPPPFADEISPRIPPRRLSPEDSGLLGGVPPAPAAANGCRCEPGCAGAWARAGHQRRSSARRIALLW